MPHSELASATSQINWKFSGTDNTRILADLPALQAWKAREEQEKAQFLQEQQTKARRAKEDKQGTIEEKQRQNTLLNEGVKLARQGTPKDIAIHQEKIQSEISYLQWLNNYDEEAQKTLEQFELLQKSLEQRLQFIRDQENTKKERQALQENERKDILHSRLVDGISAYLSLNEKQGREGFKETLVAHETGPDFDFESYVVEKAKKLEDINVTQLADAKSVIQAILFSEQNISDTLWEQLNKPNMLQVLKKGIETNAQLTWDKTTNDITKLGDKETFVQKQLDRLTKTLKEKNDHTYLAFLLKQLGMDLSLLQQTLQARLQNNNEPFVGPLDASVALLGEKGSQWWQNIQKKKETEPIIFNPEPAKLTFASTTAVNAEFSEALLLKVGLSTPSTFIEYDATLTTLEVEHARNCLDTLQEYYEIHRLGFGEKYEEQLSKFSREETFIKEKLRGLAKEFRLLNQTLGGTELNSITPETNAARDYLMRIFVSSATENKTQKLSALAALFDQHLDAWLKKNPQEERMS